MVKAAAADSALAAANEVSFNKAAEKAVTAAKQALEAANKAVEAASMAAVSTGINHTYDARQRSPPPLADAITDAVKKVKEDAEAASAAALRAKNDADAASAAAVQAKNDGQATSAAAIRAMNDVEALRSTAASKIFTLLFFLILLLHLFPNRYHRSNKELVSSSYL